MIFRFYRVNHQWALKILVDNTEFSPTLFPPNVTDEDITQLAITLAKGDNISTTVDFKGK